MKFLKEHPSVHFVGIGGIGMSALARLWHESGFKVTGSDQVQTELTRALLCEGIELQIGHDASLLEPSVALVVYSEAIPESNPERQKALELGLKTLNYFEALGELTKDQKLIAIAGTHGKTTTTAMLGQILIEAGLDPTVVVGSKVPAWGNRNLRRGKGELFVLEACEYRENFLALHPHLLGVVNLDLDHLDFFKDAASYRAAFERLAQQSEHCIWPDDFNPFEGELCVLGKHNRENAGLAAKVAVFLGVSKEIIAASLRSFKGTWRRLEAKPSVNGALVFDDYAHHPVEIKATLGALKEAYPKRKLWVVFQPHQFNRTKHFLDDFARSFEQADHVIIPNIYGVRDSDEDRSAVSAEALVGAISALHSSARHGSGLKQTAKLLKSELTEKDLLVVMGAGDVDGIFDFL